MTVFRKIPLSTGLDRKRTSVICISFIAALLFGCAPSQKSGLEDTADARAAAFNASEYGLAHNERKRRLEEISKDSRVITPNFFEYLVQKSDIANGQPQPVLRVVFDEKVFFDTASAEIRREAFPVLEVVARALRQEKQGTVLFVAGHTDSRGSESYNLNLSVKRANSVALALSKRDVGTAKIWRVGFGKAIPLWPNDSSEHMARNRRVEFIVADSSATVTSWLSGQRGYLCAEGAEQVAEVCNEPISRNPPKFEAVPVNSDANIRSQHLGKRQEKKVMLERVEPIEIKVQPSIINVDRPVR